MVEYDRISGKTPPPNRWAAHSLTAGGVGVFRKLWLSFGILMLVAVIGGLVTFLYIQRIDRKLMHVVAVEAPLGQAILEMEINAGETAIAVQHYVLDQDPKHLETIQDSEADYARYAAVFEQLAETDEERQHGQEVARLYRQFRIQGSEIVELSVVRESALESLQRDVIALDELIDEKLQKIIDRAAPHALQKLEAALDMEINIFEAFAAIEGYILRPDPAMHREIEDAEADFERFVAMYREAGPSAEETGWLERIDRDFTEAVASGKRIVDISDELNKKQEAFEADLEALDTILDDRIQPLIHVETVKAVAEANDAMATATLLILIIGAITLLAGSGSAWALSRTILIPVNALVRGTRIVGKGDLTHRIDVKGKDEFNLLATAFNRMVEKVQNALQSVQEHTAQLNQELDERKRAEEALRKSEQQFRDVASVATDWFWETDEDDHFVYVSKEFFEMMRVSPESVIGKTRREFIQSRDIESETEKWRRHFEDLKARRPFRNMEYTIRGADGERRYISVSAIPYFDAAGQFLGYHGASTNITERKNAERRLNAAKEEAELANRAKTNFLANMSHELRTPLSAITGFAEMIRCEMLGPVGNPKYLEYARDIGESSEHLLALINDILDLSKVEADMIDLRKSVFDVNKSVESCLQLVKERAGTADVKLIEEVADGLPQIYADERRLKQILINLLSNAVKFTPAGGEVTVKIWFHANDGHMIQIRDTGIGIAPEAIISALAPFQQIENDLDRTYEGTGLGLPLSKSLVELHSGSLDLQSEIGVGTTVTLCFPTRQALQESASGT